MNRIQVTKIIAFVTCLLFFITFAAPPGTFLATQSDVWEAHPMYVSVHASTSTPHGYSPSQIRTAYNLPSSGGAGTTIGIIDAYDTPDILAYFNMFSDTYGLPNNSSGNFLVHPMDQSIQSNSSGWSIETCLDVEWAHAIAPNATILLVEAVDPTIPALLSAIDYATSQPGVVAVSMSWGGEEFSGETSYSYESHFNKPGITFFASSGDDGSSVIWPAASAHVVSVGATTLDLNSDGTVISEYAWQNSSGGLSAYVARPAYQTSFNLPYSNRAVPDVSFSGNPSTGVSVYYGNWLVVGGTSAGAPSWAAINGLGLSATNANLYIRAKLAYSTYFRDITSGSNYVNSADTGYDLVTGLGSPLTFSFGTSLGVSPTSGPAGGSVTLSGSGFTANGSVNLSYRNPISATWVPIVNNFLTTSSNFIYTLNVPDLVQNNLAGDHQALFDNIVFRAQDNRNNQTYRTPVPYMEMRRSLTQIGNSIASGGFGNNTDFSTTVFVQNSQSITVLGNWFSSGSVSLLWDDSLSLGTAFVDEEGDFSASFQVPITTAGQHRLTLNDGSSNFCVNLTRLPTVANDYVEGWHTSNITINLTPDYPVDETFYSINNGPILNVNANGQPSITTEGNNSSLEYWSTWDVFGTGLNDLPHVTLTGIQLDKTAPTGTLSTASITATPTVTLTLSATDFPAGIAQMRFSNDNSTWSNWEPYATSKTWTLQEGNGQKTVYVQLMNNAGLTSTLNYTLNLEIAQPTATPTPTTEISPNSSISPTSSPTPTPTPTSSPTPATNTPSSTSLSPPSPTSLPTSSTNPNPLPNNSSAAPEIMGLIMILIVFAVFVLIFVFVKRRK